MLVGRKVVMSRSAAHWIDKKGTKGDEGTLVLAGENALPSLKRVRLPRTKICPPSGLTLERIQRPIACFHIMYAHHKRMMSKLQ